MNVLPADRASSSTVVYRFWANFQCVRCANMQRKATITQRLCMPKVKTNGGRTHHRGPKQSNSDINHDGCSQNTHSAENRIATLCAITHPGLFVHPSTLP